MADEMDLTTEAVTPATVKYGHKVYGALAAGTEFKIELPGVDVLRYTVPAGMTAEITVRIEIHETAT